MKHKKALLVIDMQKGSFISKTPRFDTEGVILRINKLSKLFRNSGFPVIFIQHDGTSANEFIPNTTEWEILDALNVDAIDICVNKYANDPFYKSKLQSLLSYHKVDELYITGCATDFCIASTIQSSIVKDYDITVVEDGHTTGERPHLKANKIIEHYNWVWKNMIKTEGNLVVKNFKQIEKEMITT
ncbi:isochorismatase [Aquimarina aggregata]|uniref:Isochorismatase n=1 Tax=Aquimarina aggregata TaxID=1642818 RepID=A0A162XH06_9FLAO|nr:isochorismatase family protein [Aquimarina aggregata]KZS38631.1 isochorismatase [Aquimarina aggregata]